MTAVPDNVRRLALGERAPAVVLRADDDDRDFSRQFDFSLDFWWLYLYYFGVISAPVALALGLAPLLAASLVLRRVLAPEVIPLTDLRHGNGV